MKRNGWRGTDEDEWIFGIYEEEWIKRNSWLGIIKEEQLKRNGWLRQLMKINNERGTNEEDQMKGNGSRGWQIEERMKMYKWRGMYSKCIDEYIFMKLNTAHELRGRNSKYLKLYNWNNSTNTEDARLPPWNDWRFSFSIRPKAIERAYNDLIMSACGGWSGSNLILIPNYRGH